MIKFFRKIRYDLMEKNKTGKYLKYAIGEIVLVVIGILIALSINNWNQVRLERMEEVNAVSRFLADIQVDLDLFDMRIKALKAKEESLLRVKKTFSNGLSSDLKSFFNDIIIGADFGWNQGIAQHSAYDDLLGSGKLGIIKNSFIRFNISNYYLNYENEHNRIDERETAYPNLSYQLIPRNIIHQGKSEIEVELGLTKEQLREIAKLIDDSPIRSYVTSEINLGRFIRGITMEIQSQAVNLVKQLKEYQKEIE
jgi:hypothetical protein